MQQNDIVQQTRYIFCVLCQYKNILSTIPILDISPLYLQGIKPQDMDKLWRMGGVEEDKMELRSRQTFLG